MTTTPQIRESYAQWLRREMQEREVTQRELARRLNPEDPETSRRAVRRYLKGMVPLVRTRRLISDALGVEAIGPDPDDAEDD